jgi:hypothetical protein
MKPKAYIVVFDDEQGLAFNYTDEKDCTGALCYGSPVRLFPDRKSARKAIRVSVVYAKLCAAQGKPVNTDFTDAIKCIKIVPCI